MGTTHRFLATVEEGPVVLDWFRSLPERPVESPRDAGAVFLFRDFGPLQPEQSKSPLVWVLRPVRRRGVLTTIGEVHFTPTPLAACPGLNRVSKRFRAWLRQHPCVFSHRPGVAGEWDYFLEAGAQNWASDIFALPEGLAALRRGSYFVAEDATDGRLDVLCRQLRLRGVTGIEPAAPPTSRPSV